MTNDRPPIRDSESEWRRLGERLRESREYLGLSQEAVAEALGIPRPSVSAIETGKRKVSSVELTRLARLYRRPYEFLLGEQETDDDAVDDTSKELYRAASELSDTDREQVLRFAQFLKRAGPAPRRPGGSG